jgi:nickel-dependent lactate racemase
VRGIIAVGSHERFSPGNRRIMARFQAIAGELGLRAEVSVHDCQDPSLHVQLGRTSRGTPVEVSRHALEADVLVVTSDLKNHYFAGYSNPLKSLLPGVSSFASIEKNHSLALEPDAAAGRHPWHPDAGRRANPVAEDMLEAARMVTAGKAVFVLACVSVPAGLVWARAGEMEAVTRQGIAQVDHTAVARVSAAPFLIVSPGGTPEDETLYNAQRGLELSRDGVQPGGEVLFVARCDRGAAPTAQARAEFYDRLKPPLQEVIAGLKARYILYSHKAFKFAQFIQSVRRICMVTDLSADEVSAAHMERAADPQAVVDGWLRQSHAPIIVSTQANRVVLRS